MSLINEFKETQKRNTAVTQRFINKWKGLIPDDEAEKYANYMYDRIVGGLRGRVVSRAIVYDWKKVGILKKRNIKVNHRYEYGDIRNIYIQKDRYLSMNMDARSIENEERIFEYLIFSDGNMSDSVNCGNPQSVNKVYELVKKKLEDENIKVIYVYKPPNDVLIGGKVSIMAIIPCDSEGNIIA